MFIGFYNRKVLFITIFVHFANPSKIYVIDEPNHNEDYLKFSMEYPDRDVGYTYPQHDTIVYKLLRIIRNNKNQDKGFIEIKSECDRYFGTTSGTNLQKLRCIERLSDKKYERTQHTKFKHKKTKQTYPLYNYYGRLIHVDRRPFVDLTRGEINFSNDYFDVRDLGRTKVERDKHFSDDYLDVGDLARVNHESSLDDNQDCYRRSDNIDNTTLAEHLKVRAYSDSESDSESEEIKVYKPKKGYKKPNRFKVDDSSALSESNSIEDEPEEKSYKNKEDSKYGFLQGGNRLYFVSDIDADSRKRLEHFLPKRYHWDEEDSQNLGYFWFNGPRGKYPSPRRAS